MSDLPEPGKLRREATAALEAARVEGARAAEIFLVATHEQHWSQGPRTLGTSSVRASAAAHLRVYLDTGRVGVAGCSGWQGVGPSLAEQAVQHARLAPEDPNPALPERQDVAATGLGIQDRRQPVLTDEDRREVLEDAVEGCQGVDPQIRPGQFNYAERLTRRYYANTRGSDLLEDSTDYALEGQVHLTEQPGVEVRASVLSRYFADVASIPLGVSLARRGASLNRKANFPDERLPLVLEPRIVAGLLTLLTPAFDERRVEEGSSFLAGRIGKAVASSELHIIDDAALQGGLNSRAFDDRGVPAMPLTLVREGVAGGLYRTPEAGRLHGTRSSGHLRASGELWPGNLVVRGGKRSRNMIYADIPRYLQVDSLLSTTGIDIRTGRLDVPARLLLCERGEVIGSVGVRRLVGRIEDLWHGVIELASDRERHGNVDSCTWFARGVNLVE